MTVLLCLVAAVTDGDTLRCTDGTRLRIAGIQAPDRTASTPCRQRRAAYTCDDRGYARSRTIVSRLVLRRRLVCRPVGTSYRRVVATCRLPGGGDLSCAVVGAGAAVWWEAYRRGYGMGECR